MTVPLRLGFVPIARPTFDIPLATEVTAQARQAFSAAGCELIGPAGLVMDAAAAETAIALLRGQPLDLLVIFQATFADSIMTVQLAGRVDAPLLLWAVPEARTGGRLRLNSLCGINLAAHGLTRAGLRYDYVHAAPGDPTALRKTQTLANAGRVRRLLRAARIGRIGEHPIGFDPCGYDPEALARQLRVSVAPVTLGEVFERVRATPTDAVEAVLKSLRERLAGLDQLDQIATQKTLGSYIALRELADAESFAGLAVRCWPEFFTELGCAACGALSMLTDELTPCSCEGDVNGTITQFILQELSGEQAFGTDLVAVDAARDEAVVWHCGLAPLSMADPVGQPRGTVHSNRKLPLLMEFPLKPGRVTIARLTQAPGRYTLVVGGGEMLRAPGSFSGTSGVLRFDRPAAEVLDTIMTAGLDHHISLTYGDHIDALLALARLLDLPVLRLT